VSDPVTDIAHPQDGIADVAGGDRSPPPRRFAMPENFSRAAARAGWALASIGLFACIWEILWFWGLADPKLLPPPHIFLGNFPEQAKFFNTAQRWQIGVGLNTGPSAEMALLITVFASAARVLVGLLIASILSISIGVAVRYFLIVEKLALPTITLLSPVSPIAWLPVAIFLFGIGNKPAIFMVVIALLFHMILATITQIDGVNRNFINVARTMGATKRQIYVRVIIPHAPLATPQEAIVEFLKKHGTVTNRQARDITGIKSENAVKREFIKLKDAGQLEMIPELKGSKAAWRLVTK